MTTPAESRTDLAVRNDAVPMPAVYAPASAEAIVAQKRVIQEAMGQVMRKGEHYDSIFEGRDGSKKQRMVLLKAGAEALNLLFRFSPSFQIQERDLGGGHREYQIVTTLASPAGEFIGQGLGTCSTMESKYRWRKGERQCPKCGAAAIIKGREEYGGGWVCFKNKGGCGAKFQDKDPLITGQQVGRVENPDPADVWNTVLKMAKKRSLVDAVITATAASDMFAQDLDEDPEAMGGGHGAYDDPQPPARQGAARQPHSAPAGGNASRGSQRRQDRQPSPRQEARQEARQVEPAANSTADPLATIYDDIDACRTESDILALWKRHGHSIQGHPDTSAICRYFSQARARLQAAEAKRTPEPGDAGDPEYIPPPNTHQEHTHHAEEAA
ncbi:hypothetical protein [Megalodesulfovibrio gigas]|uniref:Uncharacterized protein n=1 Tax=Megalodesulfovibrio gigas (strain ATCC 19364 / DSM 1382 / NCIMB 9332 / VKM B-1759) TaxID=1121448 RepID=T2GBU5_MEGG1|nr:hypothetical protein [Megalodesulfovibrio gigas]AGW13778.1 hypothetical protein DGI_2004 [Megalodesulfovibrio gigas DSM 1382 = ATCC 19364]